MPWLITIKCLVNVGIAAWYMRTTPPMAVAFLGMAVCDGGMLWVCLSVVK